MLENGVETLGNRARLSWNNIVWDKTDRRKQRARAGTSQGRPGRARAWPGRPREVSAELGSVGLFDCFVFFFCPSSVSFLHGFHSFLLLISLLREFDFLE